MLKQLVTLGLFSCMLLIQNVHASEITSIYGFAPKYIGQKVEVFAIQDYFSMNERLIATTTVGKDSTFKVSFFNEGIQKVYIKSNNNKGFMYIEPKGNYKIYLPDRNKYDEYRPLGNDVEISFIDLPEQDINYKILSFDKWLNNFLGTYFYKKNISGLEFVHKLDTFKLDVEKAYENDTSLFFKTYVRFSIASLDDIQYKGSRNRFEKYDFYLSKFPVMYENDVYMGYVSGFYKNIFSRISMETNNRIYLGVLKNSPTLVFNAMGEEYTLKNLRLRELILIKSMGEMYFKNEFPQTNIISILDSLSKNSLFKEHGIIATNLINKLTEILPGSKAPDFQFVNEAKETKSNQHFYNKYLYIQFIDLSLSESEKEVELLKPMYEKYKGDIEIITIYKKQRDYSKKQTAFLNSIPWQKGEVASDNSLFKNFKIESYPAYVLIDSYGYIVAAPALTPIPNGKYETIEKTFFLIQKQLEEIRKNEH